MFGTKKIYLTVLNDNILVRVGGGYQALDEFIRQHGEEELLKMQRDEMRAAMYERPYSHAYSNLSHQGNTIDTVSGMGSISRRQDRRGHHSGSRSHGKKSPSRTRNATPDDFPNAQQPLISILAESHTAQV